MKRFLLGTAFLLTSLISLAQVEICNNGVDDDFDGFIDCYDGSCATSPLCDGIFLGNDATCEATPPVFPQFTMSLDFASPDETTNHLSRMSIGDLDRDGIPEIVTMNRYTKRLFILSGKDGSIKRQTTVSWEPYWEVAIANLDDDNCGEIFFIGYQDFPKAQNSQDGVYMFAYDCQLNLLWTSKELPDDPINYGIADFDGDGQEEIYAKDEIYDAKTGTRIVKTTAANYARINGGPVAANVTGDTKLELILGLNIYQVNLGTRAEDAGSLTFLKGRSEYFVRNEYNATSVADFNEDGSLDVIASGSTTGNGNNTTVFFWDVQNDAIKTYSDPQPGLGNNYKNGWINGTGRINVADLDGKNGMNASFVSGRFLYALDEKWNLLWKTTINEETSGHTGCTLFDFNGDGKSEVVYRDEQYLYIIDGTDGTPYPNPPSCISRTNREYPIVADVDGDGSTELCVTCGTNDAAAWANFSTLSYSRYSQVRVYKSAAEPWVPARRVWNQHGYFVVNVNDDLSIPTLLQQHHAVFSTGNCTQGPNRPLNKFLNQAPYLNSEGCPTYASADIAFNVTPTIVPPTCPEVNFQVSFKLTNLGDVSVTGAIPVSFYTTNPLKANAVKLGTISVPVTDLKKGDIVSVDNATVSGIGSDSVYVVLNDAGTSIPTPIVFPNTSFYECDYDNIYGAKINPIPAAISALKVADNDLCRGLNNAAVRAFVPTGATENTTDYNFYWSNGAVAKPVASADFVGAIYSGIPAGTYTVYAIHKTAGCNSDTTQVVVGSTSTNIPAFTINVLSNQTSCAPLNGKLEVVIPGGGAGYTVEWYDLALNPLGITGPIANNLLAGRYVAVVTSGPCSAQATADVGGPSIADPQANVVQHVVDCSNPNSGSINADAIITGLPQNPANYTFTWYEYNNLTSTQGSILDPSHGTGPTRTALPVGHYQVELKDNASQCVSTIKPIVQITSQTVMPDAPQIVILSSQTSCDPANPNGVMTANVFIGGVAQNPANFTFEWFKGQNTLPANLVTTVSDVKGKTVNQVAGGGIPYTVKVTTANNCSVTANLPVTESIINPVVTLAQLSPNSICDPSKAASVYNGSLQATVTFNGNPVALPNNNYAFTWRNPANAIIAVADNKNPVLSGLQDGNAYSVSVTRTDISCPSNVDSEPVTKATILPQLSAVSTGSNNCNAALTPDGTVTVSITNTGASPGPFTYQWYDGNAVGVNPLGAANNGTNATAIKVGGPTGVPRPYTVEVLNTATGCVNNTTQFVADNSVVPVLSTSTTPNSICKPITSLNGSMTVSVTNIPTLYTIADYTFVWYDGNSTASTHTPQPTPATSTTLATLDAGTYSVIGTNTKTGCTSAIATNTVGNTKLIPSLATSSTGSHNCDPGKNPDGTASVSVTVAAGPFDFQWYAGSGNPITTVMTQIPATQGGNTSSANGLGGPVAAPNAYTVLVTDQNTGCSNYAGAMVADISQKPTFTLTPAANNVCNINLPSGPTQYDGSVTISAVTHPQLGSSTVTYKWYDATPAGALILPARSENGLVLSNLSAKKYAATVTIDDLGCTSDPLVREVLNDNDPPVIVPFTQANINCINPNGIARVTSVDGIVVASTSNYTYAWYNGLTASGAVIDTDEVRGTNIAGPSTSFTVEVMNKTTGCIASSPATVVDAIVTPTVTATLVKNNSICDTPTLDPDGELTATASNVGSSITFTWSGASAPATITGADNQNYTKLAAGGPYTVFVTDDNTGCQSATDSKNITNNFTFPAITISKKDQTACAAPMNGELTATVAGGVVYTWYNGIGTGGTTHAQTAANSGIINQLASGDYTVHVRITATGCEGTETRFVPNAITNPVVTLTNSQLVTTCGVTPNGQASATITGLAGAPTFASTLYDIYYAYTKAGGVAPTTSAAVIAAADLQNLTNQSVNPPPAYTGLAPGYLTAYVVDKNTLCSAVVNTAPILDNLETYDINIDAVQQAGLCGSGGGGISVTVERSDNPGVNCSTCTFAWYRGTPSNSNINFFDNLPNMTSAVLLGSPPRVNEDLGAPAFGAGVGAGTYTLVVLDSDPSHVNCGNYKTDFVPPSSLPNVTPSITHVTDCVTPNGQYSVNVNGASIAGYTLKIFRGTDATGTLVTQLAVPANPAILATAPNLSKGEYFLEILDNDGVNVGCPFGEIFKINQLVAPPVLSITNTGANTSCDPSVVADGSVTIKVDNDPSDTQGKIYRVTTANPVVAGYATPNVVGAAGMSGQSEVISGLKPIAYTFTVTDQTSNCATSINTTIPDSQGVPGVLSVLPTAETLCATGSNGSALASITGTPITDFDLFDFTWAQNNDLSGAVYASAGSNGLGNLGELLNRTHATANTPGNFWPMGIAGNGSGNRIFYVQAVKNNSAPAGVGCKTGIVQVVIPDQHLTPDITLSPEFDSFCLATAANGQLGDGQISIKADANPSLAGQQNAVGGFNYVWTNPNSVSGGMTTPQNGVSNSFTIPQLGDGSYQITATNVENGCTIVKSVSVPAAPYIININSTEPITHQRICNNDGLIRVSSITLTDNSPGSPKSQTTTNAGIDPLYNFEWYNNPALTGGTQLRDGGGAGALISERTLSNDVNQDQTVNQAGDFHAMKAGTYYAVATRTDNSQIGFGCTSLPFQVVVNDVHANPVANLEPLSNTSCLVGAPEGEIIVKITDATVAPFAGGTYSYTWAGTNPTTIGNTAVNDGDGSNADGDGDHPVSLLEGPYNLTVANNRTGCSVLGTTTIIKNATPVFVTAATTASQFLCSPDGSITIGSVTLNNRAGAQQVFDGGSTPNISDFDFEWKREGIAGSQTTVGPVGATTLNTSNYNPALFAGNPTFGAGTYTIIATRRTGAPGAGCPSAPFTVTIQDKRISPVVTLTPFANTSCSPTAFEGEIEVSVTDDNAASIDPDLFTYDWTSSATLTVIDGIQPGPSNGNASSSDGDYDHPIQLKEGDYAIRVTNTQTGCFSDAATTIFKNSTPIVTQLVTSNPQVICNNDGSLQVQEVVLKDRGNQVKRTGVTNPLDPAYLDIADFNFRWFKNTPNPADEIAVTSGAPGTVLDINSYPNIERGTYYVTSIRVNGDLGFMCESAPYKIDILDQRLFPKVDFTSTPSSSCDETNLPNGRITANASEQNGANTDPYTFTWTLNGLAIAAPSTQTDNSPSSVIANARSGDYVVTATNTVTGCPMNVPFTLQLDETLSTPNIIDITTVDPVDCNPSGSATVTKITLGSTSHSVLFPPNIPPNNEVTGVGLNSFNYEWYEGSVAPGNQLPIGGPPFTTTPAIASLVAGTYFVIVHDPTTDCRSNMKEVVISDDDIIYPVLDITQMAKQVSCIAGVGSASLAARADGNDDTNTNYVFSWFSNGNNTPPAFANTSTISNIAAGTYSVTVVDQTTSCAASDSYVIMDATQDFMPFVSTGSQPRTLCVGTDGTVVARVLQYPAGYPHPYNATTFTADLFFGATPNLSGPPDMPAIPSSGVIGNFEQIGMNEGVYTVRITDNNTGCVGVATETVRDSRQYPLLSITEISPVTNCDPARPNGVAQATANGTFVGYQFDWYEGSAVSGLPVYTGPEYSALKVTPQQYTVRATNLISGCTSDRAATVSNGTKPVPAATIEVLSNVTSCVISNGILTAFVGADKNTSNYIFHWYDGTVESPPADEIGVVYTGLAEGKYSVTATSIITGCKSPLTTGEIILEREFPDFDFIIQNTTCDQTDGFASLVMMTDVQVESIEWSVPGQLPFLLGPNFADAGAGVYEVTVTSALGCPTTKTVEIKNEIRPYNGISRNNDDQNQFFQIDCIQYFENNIVKIFNRAGTLVYEAKGYDNGNIVFDGTSNKGISPMGTNLPDGTYYFIVDKRDGSKPVAGYLEIVK